MSEPRVLSGRDEVLAGDRLRVESVAPDAWIHGPRGTAFSAVEFVACGDGDVTLDLGPGRRLVLLERPLRLPVRPYSLAVPPGERAGVDQVCVLEPMPGGSLVWYYRGHPVADDAVRDRLRRGWVAIEGPEVLS